jgi:hypothetical protein
MSTQGERQNYNWRPNDNSSPTRLRYDLEMNHWLKSLNSSSTGSLNGVSGNWGITFAVIGLILHFIVVAIWLVLVLISDLIVWIVNQFNTPKPKPKSDDWKPTIIHDNDRLREICNTTKKIDVDY